jgi:hypothetical protein
MDILAQAIPFASAFIGLGVGIGITRTHVKQHETRITILEKKVDVVISMQNDIKWVKKELGKSRT